MEDARAVRVELVRECARIVTTGAQLYNRGSVRECANLLQSSAQSLLHCILMDQKTRQIFLHALTRAAELHSEARRAWILRLAFDEAIRVSVPSSSTPRCPASRQTSAERPLSPSSSASPPPRSLPRLETGNEAAAASSLPAAPSSCLLRLPEDVCALIVARLDGRSLGALSGVCHPLRSLAQAAAEAAMRELQPNLFREAITGLRWAESSLLARSLHAIELLQAAVGPRPARPWWQEWAELRMEEARITSQQGVAVVADVSSYQPGGERSIGALLRQYAGGLSWMLDAGWPLTHAASTMLLLACGSSAIGMSIRQGTPTFAASAHALADALRMRAWSISTSVPPTYASIEGVFGLSSADPGWNQLLRPDVRVGFSFVTTAPVQASVNPTRLPESDEYLEPVHRIGSAACELRVGGPLVCFLSDWGGRGDSLRTLVQTSPIGFALPPIVRITLVAVHEPATWVSEGQLMWRRRFCVRVCCAY
jgi:hypothetical protein